MTTIEIVEAELQKSSQQSEQDYFSFHQKRYLRFNSFIREYYGLEKSEISVLDIGSHYLHNSIILKSLGFQVDGMDVSNFWNLDFVKQRAGKYGIKPIIEDNLSQLQGFQNVENKYDLIVFSEILEHITFNPIHFWKTIYQILKPGGRIYISTPNAFALPSMIRNLKNILLRLYVEYSG